MESHVYTEIERSRSCFRKRERLCITLQERQNKSFGRAFSPRRARLRIAKAFRIRITPPERQNKSFDQ
ncbi:MAG: hypothetical protein IKG82_14420, partial [Oscillospiraceae bacterium]|nr:hypothetical protein [Oscillospiraceae bacterium]